jgi:hypothetical protein
VTTLGSDTALLAVLNALRAAGLEGVFLAKRTGPSVIELSHNARRESTLHVQTDLFDACSALDEAGYDAFELGYTIVVRARPPADAYPPLAKTSGPAWEAPYDEEDEHPSVAKTSGDDSAGDADERPSIAKALGGGASESMRVA